MIGDPRRVHPAGSVVEPFWRLPLPGEACPTTAPRRFWFVIGRALGTVVVTLHGELDSTGAKQLQDALKDLIDDQGNLRVAVDLRSLRRIDSSCVAVFEAASQWACHRGGSFWMCGPSPTVSAALDQAPGGSLDVVI